MIKLAICFLALAACGLPEKTHCVSESDCLGDEACRSGVCQPTSNDACGPERARCAAEATCTDSSDGFACTCTAGYGGDGVTCADVNECAATTPACPAHAACTNLPASFSCACEAGFTGDGQSYCVPTKFKKVVASGNFSCGVAEDGGMYCWGGNDLGQLGDGTTVSHARPTQVGTATDWIDVDARYVMACGIQSDHSMWCWGLGYNGQLGDDQSMTEYVPVKVLSDKPGMGWKAMSVGRQQVCGIHFDGSLACWGIDRISSTNVTKPVAVDGNTDWTAISVGNVRCGLRGMPGMPGALYCWGKSQNGELGLGATNTQPTPMQVGSDQWKSVSVGYNNTCAIRSDSSLWCWGNNPIADVELSYGNTPRQVGTETDWEFISVGGNAIIGLRAGGIAYAWGVNDSGQLGLPPAFDVMQPTQLGGTVTGWRQITPGTSNHSCGVADGQAYCWGVIGDGALGDGTSTTLLGPKKIGTDRWTAVTGIGPGTCGLRDDGALLCWGDPGPDSSGLGFGNTDPVWSPTRLGTDTWSAVTGSTASFGFLTFCAIRGGAPYCWGDNASGQLGIGNTTTPQLNPVTVNVPPGTQWTEIAISTHTCAIRNDATLWCWGANDVGQLGIGATSDTPTTAPTAPLGNTWLHVAVMMYDFQGAMTCGIATNHTLWCWGKDQPPTMTRHLVPTQVGTGADWASLSMASTSPTSARPVSGGTVCAIKLNGTLWCWGMWLGDGSTNTATTPVQVGTAADWKTISVGEEICGTRTGGTLWCWANSSLLGDGARLTYDVMGFLVPVTRPTQIGHDADWSRVTTNGRSCAVKTDGSLWCWGYGAAPLPNYVATPVPIR